MNKLRLEPKLREIFVCVCAQAFVSALMTRSLMPSLAPVRDSDLFEQKGLMLLETARVLGPEIAEAWLPAAGLGFVALPALILCHLRLFFAAVGPELEAGRSRASSLRPLFDVFPSFLLFKLGEWTLWVGFFVALARTNLVFLHRLDEALTFVRFVPMLISNLALVLLFLCALLVFDASKLRFSLKTPGRSMLFEIGEAVLSLKSHWSALVGLRALRLLLGAGLGFLLWMLERTPSTAGWLAAAASQAFVVISLWVEAGYVGRLAARTRPVRALSAGG